MRRADPRIRARALGRLRRALCCASLCLAAAGAAMAQPSGQQPRGPQAAVRPSPATPRHDAASKSPAGDREAASMRSGEAAQKLSADGGKAMPMRRDGVVPKPAPRTSQRRSGAARRRSPRPAADVRATAALQRRGEAVAAAVRAPAAEARRPAAGQRAPDPRPLAQAAAAVPVSVPPAPAAGSASLRLADAGPTAAWPAASMEATAGRTPAALQLAQLGRPVGGMPPTTVIPPTPAVVPAGPEIYPGATDAGASAVVGGTSIAGLDYGPNAAVGRLVVEVDRDAVPADGQSPVKVTVRVYGRDGQPLAGTALVTVEHSGGRVLLPGARTDEFGPRRQDADRTVPGVQLRVDGGTAEFSLLAPAEAQDVRLRLTAGAEQAAGTVSFVPELRPMVAAGLVEGIVNFRNRTVIDPARQGDGFEREIDHWARQFNAGKANVGARAAFFLKGVIKGDLLLTAGYDSDKETRARLLRDIVPDRFYPVYGDASLRSFDARSTSRLYVRIDRKKSYLLYGDFVTGDGFSQPIGQGMVASLRQRSLGNYNRTATGVRVHEERDGLVANAFAFNDTLKQVVEEFASQGSGPYGLRNNGVLEGSEKVEVVVRDRTQPSRIVAVRPLVRLVDYTFEPFSGRILLATFLPSVDESLNPVSLRVTYEVDQGGDRFWVYGGDAQVRLGEHLSVGGSAAIDRNELAPYRLLSANATLRLGAGTVIVAEVARSSSEVNTNPVNATATPALAGRVGDVSGQAWRVELAHQGERSEARAFVGRSDPEFSNPSAPLNGGRGEAQARAAYRLTDTLKAYGEAMMSEDRNPGGGERKMAGTGLRWQATERLRLDAGVRASRETVGTQGNGVSTVPFGSTLGLGSSIGSASGGGVLGYGNQALDPATGLPVIGSGGLAAAVSNLPAGTRLSSDTARLGASYRLTDRVTVGGEVEHEFAGDARRRAAVGADVRIFERTKLYARYERQSGWSYLQGVTATGGKADAFVFGIDSTYVKDTQVFSEYRLRDAVSGRDLQLASGVRNFWDLREGLRVSTAFERIAVVSGPAASANAASVGLDWTASPLWRASTRLEHRRSGDVASTPTVNESFNTTLWQLMVARKLSRDWTLLGRNYLLKTDYTDRGDILQNRAQLGVAYRSTDTNRINALGRVEYKHESDASNAATGELKSRAFIVSTHADFHPSRAWWMTGRYAAKWQRDQFERGVTDSFGAQLVAGRLVYDITEDWDLGVLAAAQLGGAGQYGARQTAAGVEVGYLLRQNLWLSGGLNVTGFHGDRDLVGYEYTQRGAYLRLRFKFDEALFKRNDREVNRTLERDDKP